MGCPRRERSGVLMGGYQTSLKKTTMTMRTQEEATRMIEDGEEREARIRRDEKAEERGKGEEREEETARVTGAGKVNAVVREAEEAEEAEKVEEMAETAAKALNLDYKTACKLCHLLPRRDFSAKAALQGRGHRR